ncbi:MAG: NAD(P)-dependent alcohol dehydrogenase [Proteobacteria bacterium]|nr:NAD(P)-dependent alcohol dehydrogenase [Pseudomonadota bacterium]
MVELHVPEPAAADVLIRVRAASVNPYDWHHLRGSPYLMRLGTGIGSPAQPRLGTDFAGVVEAVGKDVSRFVPGDRVFGGATGAFGEYVTVSGAGSVAHLPDGVSFEQAAALPIAATTALQALRDRGGLRPGRKVLINGASGGVGTFAVQIAKSMGAEVHGVCSTRNVELVRSLGADRVFDYTQENYTGSGETYDVIVDMVGNHPIRANLRVLAPDGRLVIVGGPKGNWFAPLRRPLGALLTAPFVDQQLVTMIAGLDGDDLAALAAMVEDGSVRPVIDRRFALPAVPDAIRYSETGRARGKIVINIE